MTELAAYSWEERYQKGQDRWDLGCPAPPFINLLSSKQRPEPGKMAVLGSGSGHDALLFSSEGFDVTGFDFAPTAIARAQATAKARNLKAQFLERNIFELEPELSHQFDYVLEHTCFCAIKPELRSHYVSVVHQLLNPKGNFIALFYTHKRPDGPPYGIKPKEVLSYFEDKFQIHVFQKAKDSIARRKGNEYLAIFQMK